MVYWKKRSAKGLLALPPTSSQPDPEQPRRANVFVRALSSLRTNRNFRFLWLSNLFFLGGNWALTLVLGWLVFETTGSELRLAIFSAVRLSPMWLGPISGLMADRYDRVLIIKIASVWSVIMISGLAILVSLDATPYWLLLVAGFATGMSQSPTQPARNSLVLQLVGRGNLANANALNSMGMGITQAIAPAVGGAIISAFGASIALWYSSLWYVMAFVMIWQIRVIHQTVRFDPSPIWPMLTDGLRIVLGNQLTRTMIVVTLAANILIWPVYQSFMPVFASDVLDLGPAGLGRLMMFAGIGNFLGSFVIASLGDFRNKGAVFMYGSMIWGTGWAIFGLSQSAAVSYGLILAIGTISAAFGVLQATLMLMTSVQEVQGRALGILELAIGAMPIGTLLLGAIAQSAGVGMTTFVSGVLFVIILVTFTVRVPHLARYTGDEAETRVVGT